MEYGHKLKNFLNENYFHSLYLQAYGMDTVHMSWLGCILLFSEKVRLLRSNIVWHMNGTVRVLGTVALSSVG